MSTIACICKLANKGRVYRPVLVLLQMYNCMHFLYQHRTVHSSFISPFTYTGFSYVQCTMSGLLQARFVDPDFLFLSQIPMQIRQTKIKKDFVTPYFHDKLQIQPVYVNWQIKGECKVQDLQQHQHRTAHSPLIFQFQYTGCNN